MRYVRLLLFLCFQFWILVLPCFSWEPPRYYIDAHFDTRQHTITAQQKVTFVNPLDKEVSELYFHIYPHRHYTDKEVKRIKRYAGYFKVDPFPEGFESGDLIIQSVSSAGNALVWNIEEGDQTILKVKLANSLKPQEAVVVDISFKVVIPHAYGRFGWHKDITTLTRWYPILSVLDEQGWHNYPFYIYHQPFFSEAAYYSLRATLDQDQTLVCGAAVKEQAVNGDGTKTIVFENDAPMRDLGVGISAAFKKESLQQAGVMINAYYIEGNQVNAKKAVESAAGLIRFHSARFGQYPYKEFNIVPSYLGFGGDQSSGLIFVDTRLFRLPTFLQRYFDFLIAHETSHQWFYNIIGSDEYREMFMDEGVNSYWMLRYLEDKYGYNAYVLDLPAYLRWMMPNFTFRDSTVARYVYLAKNGYDRPVIGELSSFREPSSIFALAYGKGAAVVAMLEKYLGQENSDKAFTAYAARYRFKNASLDKLIQVFNQQTQKDLSAFFDQWLRSDKKCDFAVRVVRSKVVVVENKGDLRMPAAIKTTYSDSSSDMHQWDGQGKGYIIRLPKAKRLIRVDVDPDNIVALDIDRVNNHWPVQKKLKAVPLYFFAYELPVLAPRDAYTTTYGPSVGGSYLGLASSVQKPYDNIMRLSCGYDFSEKAVSSRWGYEVSHLDNQHDAVGVELFNIDSSKPGHDLTGGKLYIRRELWPASYGFFSANDHVTGYIIRDQKLDSSSGFNGKEDVHNISYRKKQEAILGLSGTFGRYGPYADPDYGWRITPTHEVAGHFLGGKQAFWRSSLELNNYCPVWDIKQHKIATAFKCGWGGSADKNLFELGGSDGLRGYSSKTVRGSRMALASIEYRMPLKREMNIYFLNNIFCLNKIQGVGFFDIGKAWYGDHAASDFKKDAGLGLRMHFDLCGILEKLVVRLDVAQAVNEPKEDPHVWLRINQTF